MSPPNPPPFLLLLISLIIFNPIPAVSSPLPTIAISHFSNQTLICALLPSQGDDKPYDLNCTSLPSRRSRSYPSGAALYSAIAAGDGFLCALGAHSSNVSTMRWWDFAEAHGAVPAAKRVYKGPPLAALASGGSHVCALGGGGIRCWRWPQLALPRGLNFTGVAVGGDAAYGDFACGLLDSGAIRCFGGGAGVVGNEPAGNYTAVAAGPRHACGISVDDALVCWGAGAPEMGGNRSLSLTRSLSLSLSLIKPLTPVGLDSCRLLRLCLHQRPLQNASSTSIAAPDPKGRAEIAPLRLRLRPIGPRSQKSG